MLVMADSLSAVISSGLFAAFSRLAGGLAAGCLVAGVYTISVFSSFGFVADIIIADLACAGRLVSKVTFSM